MMKVKDFFEKRTNYCPIIVETMDSGMNCKDIYSEEGGYKGCGEEARFLEEWGNEVVDSWCLVGIYDEETALLLRIEIA